MIRILKQNGYSQYRREVREVDYSDRIDVILNIIKKYYPKNYNNVKILDIGAGNAKITLEVKKQLGLDSIMALDAKTPVSSEYEKIFYNDNWDINLMIIQWML